MINSISILTLDKSRANHINQKNKWFQFHHWSNSQHREDFMIYS